MPEWCFGLSQTTGVGSGFLVNPTENEGITMKSARRVSLASTALTATLVATLFGAAHAADLGPLVTKAPLPLPVYYNWTGFYLGGNLGGSWGHQSEEAFVGSLPIAAVSDHPNGAIGGGQIGYNWQFYNPGGWGNGWVFGLEADIQGSSQRATDDFAFLASPVGPISGDFTDKLEWFGTVRGRVGIAFDRVFPYVTGGWAYGDRKLDGTLTIPAGSAAFSTTSTSTDGWTVGGGIEWAFWDHWTAKLEYLYLDLGNNNNNNNFDLLRTPVGITASHFTDNIARVGVNYKF
jgi:outer membrane immunogenic protein